MRKQVIFFTALGIVLGLLAGCGSNEVQNETDQNEQAQSEQTGDAAGKVRMGLGVVSVLERAIHAGETDGNAEISTVIAAVTVDEEGRIINCSLDALEHAIPVSNTGAFAVQSGTEYQTKKELGDDYGMLPASGIGKEWFEQAEAFEQYAVGKTIRELNGIKTDNNGYIQDETLSTSVTISISDFQAAISKAVENAA